MTTKEKKAEYDKIYKAKNKEKAKIQNKILVDAQKDLIRTDIGAYLIAKYKDMKYRTICKRKKPFNLKFSEWELFCYDSSNFNILSDLYDSWIDSDYEYRLSPSIDRINNSKGYELGNMQWLTVYGNSKKGVK